MPTPADQLPPDIGSLGRRLLALETQLRELRAARRLEAATVGAGGLGVAKGGRLFMTTPDGTRVLDLGAINNSVYNNVDGSQQQAHFIRRQDGSLALSVFGSPGQPRQFLAIWDSAGNIIAADDAVSGVGLARPYLPVPMGPAFAAGWDYWPRTTSTTFVELWGGLLYRQQPRLVVVVSTSMDTSGATGQVQLTVNGVAQGSPQNVSFAVGSVTFGPVDMTGWDYMAQVPIAVTAKCLTGTGTIRASVLAAYTLQS